MTGPQTSHGRRVQCITPQGFAEEYIFYGRVLVMSLETCELVSDEHDAHRLPVGTIVRFL